MFIGRYLGVSVVYLRFSATMTVEKTAVTNRTEDAVSQFSGAIPTVNNNPATVSIPIGVPVINATSNDDQLRAGITYKTREIPKKDMFMAVITALLVLAGHENEERVRIDRNNRGICYHCERDHLLYQGHGQSAPSGPIKIWQPHILISETTRNSAARKRVSPNGCCSERWQCCDW